MRLGNFFEGRIDPEASKDRLNEMFDEGKERYTSGIGPGFADAAEKQKEQATEREIYGDYIIWRQIIEKAKEAQLPIIYVTEDTKED